MTDQPVLAAHDVSKTFGSTRALAEMSFSIEPGRVIALIGENGAGKSTLMKILAGVHTPDSGQVLVDGTPVVFDGAQDAARRGIHLVHQELALLPERTVTENIFLGRELRRRGGWLDRRTMRRDAVETLAELGGHSIDPDTRVKHLSTGSQQLVEIARTLVGQARVIILDEPTAALSPAEAEHLFSVMRRMTERGIAFVYISHRLSEVERVADVVTVMKDGRHVTTRPRGELSVERMVSLMVGREITDLFPPGRTTVSSAAPALVEVEGLADPPAVKGASLTLRRGEIVGLYGLEGHGQDEVLACLAGARRPAAGTLRVDGRRLDWPDVAAASAAGFGYVPEDRKSEGLLLDLSGVENLTLPVLRSKVARRGLVSASRERRVAQESVEAAGVRGDVRAPVETLSGGNQQKIVLARWIAAGARVLLLNQPTRGVDVGSKAEIYALVRDLCEQHDATALVVSREITELQGLCDRILVMSHGRLVAEHPRTAGEEEVLLSAVGDR